ncbi:PaaI family thioesterase [Allokutzneria sp. A3M-2-11 16]|uniref:PaaI family thioesterase n=1 Tax=Allokutzneria sp. A3M-2-11 16 TaxID=2962043 RepID=UPI0020B76E2E|nr:PaaI family thioesterase [Allokutzneria sp. A3M-2-11 16]MCP3802223.1 PaaI family thioesterase [Allokutzneria sp. A3M-2-11 16]
MNKALLDLWSSASGLELMRVLAENPEPQSDQYSMLGLQVSRAAEGRVEMAWTPGDSLANFVGTVHGGYTAMVLDETCCSAGVSIGDRCYPMNTLNLTVDYVRAVQPGKAYSVVAEVVHAGRARLLTNASIRDDEGNLVAQAHAALLPNKPQPKAEQDGTTTP